MKTIAEQLNIKEFPFKIKDNNGNEIYYEESNGYWIKYEYDSNDNTTYDNTTYYENSDGFWIKREFDSNGNLIYYKNSKGYWSKREYDSNDNQIYYENSKGLINDNRPKEVILTLDEIANKFGIDVKDLKVKK